MVARSTNEDAREDAAQPDGGPALLDLVHLRRQTMDDPVLEAEVLELFTRQARRLESEIADARGEERRRLAHTLKGAARGVGAFEVASHAEALEADPGDAALAAALGLRIADTCRFIASRRI